MRRTALIFGLLLTLTSGVWGGALAAVVNACCTKEASASDAAAAPTPDEHDCCRAKLDASNASHSEASEHAHAAATHEDALAPEPQADNSHVAMDCESADEPGNEATAAFGERGRSCLECCAGRSNQVPTNATLSAPEQNRMKRAAANASAVVRDSFAPATSGIAHLAPSQHAPPAPCERRHVLISVFLI